jgi:hypothetical protein
MSRWIENFKNHAFQKVWINILDKSKKISVDATTLTDVKELARLKKVIKYIDELLNACDPEIIPSSVWDNFNAQSTDCLAQINLFNQNKNIGHLQNSNANLDNLLTYIRPYMLSSGSAAQAAGKAFKAYSDAVAKEMSNFKELVQQDATDIKTTFNDSKTTYSSIEKIRIQIEEFNSNLFIDKDNVNSFRTRAENLLTEVNAWHENIKNYHNTLLLDTDGKESLKQQIVVAAKNIFDSKANATQTLKDIESDLSDFKKFYSETFGVKNKDTGEFEGGLNRKLEDGFKKYNTLLKSIEKLLPGATSAGLASSYGSLKESFDKIIKNNTYIFYGILTILVITSGGFYYKEFIDISDFQKLLPNFLYKLSFFAPLIWLAFFASKRRSEAQRLQQEYAHKEAITKSYESFKQQIENLGQKNEALMSKLLDTAISAIAYNASTTLDKKHGDKMPIHELLDTTASKIRNPLNH